MTETRNEEVARSRLCRLIVGAFAMLGWAFVVCVFLFAGIYLFELILNEPSNPCHQLHESPNNVGGWFVASIGTMVPLLIGCSLRKQISLWWVIICSAGQMYMFTYYILNWRGC